MKRQKVRSAEPDPDDEPFLAVAEYTDAVLVTGNLKHFPAKACAGVQVLSPRGFLDHLRDRPAHFPGSELQAVPLFDGVLEHVFLDRDSHATPFMESRDDVIEQQNRDIPDFLLRQGIEEHDVVEAVEEFGGEKGTLHDRVDEIRFEGCLRQVPGIPDRIADEEGSGIGGCDNDAVSKVRLPLAAVDQRPFVEDLEEEVEHRGVRLLEFVEENEREGAVLDALREVPFGESRTGFG